MEVSSWVSITVYRKMNATFLKFWQKIVAICRCFSLEWCETHTLQFAWNLFQPDEQACFCPFTFVFSKKSFPPLSKRTAAFSLEVNWSCDSVGHFQKHANAIKCFLDAFVIHLSIDISDKPLHESIKNKSCSHIREIFFIFRCLLALFF